MNKSVKIQPLVRVAAPVREHVADVVRQMISAGDFAPGERLIERELCELIGASRSSVREALRHLETEGLVRVLAHHGPVVAEISREEAEEIYEVRAVLEGLAGRLFTERGDPAELEALRATLEGVRNSSECGDSRKALAAKDAFYDCLLTGAQNKIVLSTLRSLHGRISLLRATSMSAPGRLAEAYGEIAGIVEAIEAGDAREAERRCTQHVRNASKTAWHQLCGEQHAEGAGA